MGQNLAFYLFDFDFPCHLLGVFCRGIFASFLSKVKKFVLYFLSGVRKNMIIGVVVG